MIARDDLGCSLDNSRRQPFLLGLESFGRRTRSSRTDEKPTDSVPPPSWLRVTSRVSNRAALRFKARTVAISACAFRLFVPGVLIPRTLDVKGLTAGKRIAYIFFFFFVEASAFSRTGFEAGFLNFYAAEPRFTFLRHSFPGNFTEYKY